MPGIILLFLFSLNLCSVLSKPVVTTSFNRKAGESSSSSELEVPLSVTQNQRTLEVFGTSGQNNHQKLIQLPDIGVNLREENEEENDPPDLETILNPTFYLINGEDDVVSEQVPLHHRQLRQPQGQKEAELGRERRNIGTSNGPSLSIVNPLDVLRQRLLMEISRRKMDQSNRQIIANAEILKNIGKRNWSS